MREQIVDEDDLVEKLMDDNLLPNADILAVVESLKPKEKTVEEIAAAISPEKMHVELWFFPKFYKKPETTQANCRTLKKVKVLHFAEYMYGKM